MSFIEENFLAHDIKVSNRIFFVATIVCLVFLAGTRTVGFDFDNYREIFDEVNLKNYEDNYVEYGYALLISIFKWANLSYYYFLFFVAMLGIIPKAYFMIKESKNSFLSLVSYFSVGFIINEMGQMRQGIALSIMYFAFIELFNNRKKNYVLLVLFASIFHTSAIIALPVLLFSGIRIAPRSIVLVTIAFIPFVFLNLGAFLLALIPLLPLQQIQAKIVFYVASEQFGQSLGLNMSLVLRIFILILMSLYYKVGQSKSKHYGHLVSLYAYGIVLYLVFNSISDFAIRTSLYFKSLEIIILPLFVKFAENHLMKNFILLCVIIYSFWSLYKIVFDPIFSPSYSPYHSILFF